MRLLWDPRPDGSDIVILGDSAFASYYVDSPGETLWAQLAKAATGRVFPGALNGATLADLQCSAALVASRWPPGTLALVGIHRFRLYSISFGTAPLDRHYERQFVHLGACRPTERGPMPSLDSLILASTSRHLFLVRGRDWIQTALANRLNRRTFFRVGGSGNRTWDADGSFAVDRLSDFEHLLASDPDRQNLPGLWFAEFARPLTARESRVIFVLTPLNRTLLERHASRTTLDTVLQSHAELEEHLRRSGFEFIDLFEAVEPNGFADAIHTNALGDRRIAELIAARLSSKRHGRL